MLGIRALPALLALFFLPACTTGDTIGRGTEFTASSADALVVMGLRSTTSHFIDYRIVWLPVDPVSKRLIDTADRMVTLERDKGEIFTSEGMTDTKYLTFRVPPGQYALFSAEIGATFKIRYSPDAPSFTAQPGEILYLGDFTFVLPTKTHAEGGDIRDSRFVLSGRDDRAAQAAIASYSGVRGTATYRMLDSVRLNEG